MNLFFNLIFSIFMLAPAPALCTIGDAYDNSYGVDLDALETKIFNEKTGKWEREKLDTKACKPTYKNIPLRVLDTTDKTKGENLILEQSLMVGALQHPNDKLLSAIIKTDLKQVSANIINKSQLNKHIKINFYVKVNGKITEFLTETTYLALAIIKYRTSTDLLSREKLLKIITLLLAKGSNPNTLIGTAFFEWDQCSWIDFPFTAPATFDALECNDKATLLKLLFEHGACANGKAPTYGNLMHYAQKYKARECIDAINAYLKTQSKKGICRG